MLEGGRQLIFILIDEVHSCPATSPQFQHWGIVAVCKHLTCHASEYDPPCNREAPREGLQGLPFHHQRITHSNQIKPAACMQEAANGSTKCVRIYAFKQSHISIAVSAFPTCSCTGVHIVEYISENSLHFSNKRFHESSGQVPSFVRARTGCKLPTAVELYWPTWEVVDGYRWRVWRRPERPADPVSQLTLSERSTPFSPSSTPSRSHCCYQNLMPSHNELYDDRITKRGNYIPWWACCGTVCMVYTLSNGIWPFAWLCTLVL